MFEPLPKEAYLVNPTLVARHPLGQRSLDVTAHPFCVYSREHQSRPDDVSFQTEDPKSSKGKNNKNILEPHFVESSLFETKSISTYIIYHCCTSGKRPAHSGIGSRARNSGSPCFVLTSRLRTPWQSRNTCQIVRKTMETIRSLPSTTPFITRQHQLNSFHHSDTWC